jgi:hypothetical protein
VSIVQGAFSVAPCLTFSSLYRGRGVRSPVRESVAVLLQSLDAPFTLRKKNSGLLVAGGRELHGWLHGDAGVLATLQQLCGEGEGPADMHGIAAVFDPMLLPSSLLLTGGGNALGFKQPTLSTRHAPRDERISRCALMPFLRAVRHASMHHAIPSCTQRHERSINTATGGVEQDAGRNRRCGGQIWWRRRSGACALSPLRILPHSLRVSV